MRRNLWICSMGTTLMTDTTRNLIQRLADELDAETGYTIYNTGERITHPDVVEARAYLAHPEADLDSERIGEARASG